MKYKRYYDCQVKKSFRYFYNNEQNINFIYIK